MLGKRALNYFKQREQKRALVVNVTATTDTPTVTTERVWPTALFVPFQEVNISLKGQG